MKIAGAFAVDMDIVSAAVILERDVKRLMYIADPVPEKFQRDEAVS